MLIYSNLQHPKTIDARRLSDGKNVFLKRTRKGTEEINITKFFSQPELRANPANHAVPLLDVISDPSLKDDFIVLPVLHRFYDPRFAYVEEALDFIQQTLEVSLVRFSFYHRLTKFAGIGVLS